MSTLREIFNGLASEGLITAEGARGFEVASISPDNLREVAAMRQLLECDALRSSFEAGDVEWEGRVVAAHHKLASLEKRMAAGDRSEEETLRRYDWEFHNALISACGSRVLLDMHAGIYDKYLRYLMLAAVFRGEPVVGRASQAAEFCAGTRLALGAGDDDHPYPGLRGADGFRRLVAWLSRKFAETRWRRRSVSRRSVHRTDTADRGSPASTDSPA